LRPEKNQGNFMQAKDSGKSHRQGQGRSKRSFSPQHSRSNTSRTGQKGASDWMYAPAEILPYVNNLARQKGSYKTSKVLVLGFLAGAYIAFGSMLAILVGGGSPEVSPGIQKFLFGAVFPLGLIMVMLAGAELFTGNASYFIPNVMNGKQSWKAVFRNWGLVYVSNFVGCIFIAYFLTHLTGTLSAEPWSESVQNIAAAKTANPFYKTFLKGIGANWLVCLAMWLGMSAKDTTGKILGMWWPVMAFVAMGFEHSIANMYFLPLSIMEGGELGWGQMVISNLIPATLGNIVGGAFFVGFLYWFSYDKQPKPVIKRVPRRNI
jgi:formate/nitrite transporter